MGRQNPALVHEVFLDVTEPDNRPANGYPVSAYPPFSVQRKTLFVLFHQFSRSRSTTLSRQINLYAKYGITAESSSRIGIQITSGSSVK